MLTALVTTLFVPLTTGAGDTTLQTFVLRLVLASKVKPVKFVAHDSTIFVFALRCIFKIDGCGVKNTIRTDSLMLSEPSLWPLR